MAMGINMSWIFVDGVDQETCLRLSIWHPLPP
jgi:hypothetical protein